MKNHELWDNPVKWGDYACKSGGEIEENPRGGYTTIQCTIKALDMPSKPWDVVGRENSLVNGM